MKMLEIILLNLIVILLTLNMAHADARSDAKKKHIETLKQTRTLQCTVDIKANHGNASWFNCISEVDGISITHEIIFYQMESYNRDLWNEYYRSSKAKQLLKERYADKSKINLQLIDGNADRTLVELMNLQDVNVKVTDIPNAIYITAGSSAISVVGTVYLNNLDIGLELVKRGFAWASPPQWPSNPEYDDAQKSAKENSLGYWDHKNTVSPWEIQAIYTEIKSKVDAESSAYYKSERRKSMILAWITFITIPLGLMGVIYAIYRMKSGIAVFTLLIPYIAIGGNLFIIADYVYNPNSLYALYGFFFTIPISVCSILIGGIAFIIKVAIQK